MPRKAPTQVIEQRVTLGDLERSQVIPILNETRQLLKSGRVVTQVVAGTTATVGILAAGGIALAGYGVYNWFMEESWFAASSKWWQAKKDKAWNTFDSKEGAQTPDDTGRIRKTSPDSVWGRFLRGFGR
tara:strand:- start:595 stop:981 length:387 start_codon:yes stop_codon:yes gene_type:complete